MLTTKRARKRGALAILLLGASIVTVQVWLLQPVTAGAQPVKLDAIGAAKLDRLHKHVVDRTTADDDDIAENGPPRTLIPPERAVEIARRIQPTGQVRVAARQGSHGQPAYEVRIGKTSVQVHAESGAVSEIREERDDD